MLAAAKSKAKTFILRASLGLNAAALALAFVAYLGVHTGHVQADVQLTGWEVGGGTAEHQALNGSMQRLASAIPTSALTQTATTKMTADMPRPTEKPQVPK